MRWSDILGFNRQCTHDNIPIEQDYCYCPDCGELIENQWYLVRCASCGLREPATVRNGEVVPLNKFCHNCGGKSYIVERIDKINCININYAVLVKAVVDNNVNEYTQSWVDAMQTNNVLQRLLQ